MLKSFRILLFLSAAAMLGGCSGSGELPPVFVGHVAPQSGPDRQAGASAARGIRLAVVEANQDVEKGAGRPVKVIHTDTLSNPKAFESQAVRLATASRAVALLGGTNAEEVEQLERARVPLVTAAGQRPRTQNEAVFCTGLAPDFVGRVLAQFAADELKTTKLAVIVDETREDAVQLAEAFTREITTQMKKGGGAGPPAPLRFGRSVPLEGLAESLRADAPPVALFAGKAEDLRTLRQLLDGGPKVVLFGGPEGSAADLASARATSGGVYLVTAFHPDATEPRAREFVEKYTKAFGEAPDVHAALGYDGARVLFEAMRQTRDLPAGPKLRDKLAGIKDFPGLPGPLSFGEDRVARRPGYVIGLEDGRAKLLKKVAADE